jgi:DNA-binding response OmpR family regulator
VRREQETMTMSQSPKPFDRDFFRILIVDDDTDFAEGVAELFAAQGYATAMANSQPEALREQFRFRPDVAIVDLCLGRSNGIDVIEDLKLENPEVSCIVLTAHADVDSAVRAMSKGVQHYLRKPISGEDLLAVVQECCVRVASQQERQRAENRRRVLESQVRRSEKLESMGVLAGGLAHDFNNLLVGMLGHVGLALMDLAPGHPARDELLAVEKAALRAADLCKQMLTYSGKGRFDKRPVQMGDLLLGLGGMLKQTLGEQIRLRLPDTTGIPPIEGDSAQLRQMMLNLILNAAEAIGDAEGLIDVGLSAQGFDEAALNEFAYRKDLPEGTYVCVEVRDNGVGMDSVTMQRIFDPFFTTKFTGRGLGMAAVLGIVHGHNGFIHLRSAPESGTTVLVGLPAPAGMAAEEVDTTSLWGAGMGMLIVEDDDLLRNIVRKVLEEEGFRVWTAVDGLQGLDRFREHASEIHLILLDLILPGISGEEVYEEVRRTHPEVPVLVTSGWHAQDLSKVYRAENHAGFLPKPFQARDLLARARAMITAR